MFQNLGDDRVRDILLALSLGAMFLYGFYIMKKVDEFLKEIRKSSRGHNPLLTNTKVICYNNKGDPYDC